MNTETIETTEKPGRLKKTLEAAGKGAAVAIDAELLKKRLENAVEGALVDAKRAAKRGKYAAEDIVDDTTHLIKKNPWQSVGYAAGAGFGLGLFAGWLMRRRNGDNEH